MQDAQCRFVFHRGAQIGGKALLVGVGCRQAQRPVPVALRGQRVENRCDGVGVIADDQPGAALTRGCGGCRCRHQPADLVARVRDGLGVALPIVLGGKLVENISGGQAGTRGVEQGREFLDAAVLEKPDGIGADGVVLGRLRLLVAEPVLPVLERVGGQVQLARGACQQRGEVGQVSGHVGVGHRLGDVAVIRTVAPHRRNGARSVGRVGPGAHGGGGQHRLRADLQQHRAAEIGQGGHALGELDGLACVPAPVGAVQFGGAAQGRTGPVAHQDPLWCREVELVGKGLEGVQGRVQQRGVEGVAGVQPVAAHAVGGQSGHRPLQVRTGAGEHRVGAVVGRHRQAGVFVGEPFDAVGGGEDRGHPPAGGQVAEQSAPLGQQARTVLEAEHPGDTGRRVLADAVADDHIRFVAPGLPEPGQAHLHREDRRLGVAGLAQRLLAVDRVVDDLQQRLLENAGDGVGAPPDGFGEHRLGLEQFPGHPGVLAALSGEQPGRLGGVGAVPADQAGSRAVVGERAEQLTRGFGRVHHQCGPVLEMGAPVTGGQAHVGQLGVRVIGQPAAVVLGGFDQRGGGACGQRQHHEAPGVGDVLGGGRRHRRCLLQDDVRVRAGKAERADARDAGTLAALPGGGLVDHPDRDAIPRDMR